MKAQRFSKIFPVSTAAFVGMHARKTQREVVAPGILGLDMRKESLCSFWTLTIFWEQDACQTALPSAPAQIIHLQFSRSAHFTTAQEIQPRNGSHSPAVTIYSSSSTTTYRGTPCPYCGDDPPLKNFKGLMKDMSVFKTLSYIQGHC